MTVALENVKIQACTVVSSTHQRSFTTINSNCPVYLVSLRRLLSRFYMGSGKVILVGSVGDAPL